MRKSIGPNPYQACPALTVRSTGRDPYASACVWFGEFADGPHASIIRRADAQTRCREMADVEDAVLAHEKSIAAVADQLERMQAAHRFNMQYLVEFGVRADERHAFREVLAAVGSNGNLTLYQAAEVARAKARAAMNPGSVA